MVSSTTALWIEAADKNMTSHLYVNDNTATDLLRRSFWSILVIETLVLRLKLPSLGWKLTLIQRTRISRRYARK